MKNKFVVPTLIFSAAGIFMSGFTSVFLLGLQFLISMYGFDCTNAWTIIRFVSTVIAIILPWLFYRYVVKLTSDKLDSLELWLTLFNLIEFIFLQSSLSSFFSSATLCFVSDGQNGVQLVLSAILGLPILILFSLLFNWTLTNRNQQFKSR